MLHPPSEVLRRRLIVVGLVLGLFLAAFITYAALVERAAPSGTPATAPESAAGEPSENEGHPTAVDLRPLRTASDPETFARLVALALFEWDTGTLISRGDHIQQLAAVADPTGESTAGLVSDLTNYLPTKDAWAQLAQYQTRQWLSVETVTIPTMWAEAEAQAGDALLPGTTAFTIHGTRHRWGVWEGEPVTSEHEVAFTVFIVCGPSYPECHLLRLSLLNKPLA